MPLAHNIPIARVLLCWVGHVGLKNMPLVMSQKLEKLHFMVVVVVVVVVVESGPPNVCENNENIFFFFFFFLFLIFLSPCTLLSVLTHIFVYSSY